MTGKLQTRPTPLPLLINTQHYLLLQITVCLLWRQTPGCLASCEHSLSGVQAHTILRLHAWFTHSRDCAHVLRNLKITHTCYAIPRLPAHSWDSEYAQHNLEIAQIPRLRGTYMYLGICVCIHEMCSQHPPSWCVDPYPNHVCLVIFVGTNFSWNRPKFGFQKILRF